MWFGQILDLTMSWICISKTMTSFLSLNIMLQISIKVIEENKDENI